MTPPTKRSLPSTFISLFFLVLACRLQYIESFTSSRSSTSTTSSSRKTAIATTRKLDGSTASATTKSVLNLFFDDNNNDNNPRQTEQQQQQHEDVFFIRSCTPADVGRLADILTEVFFKHKTNFVTYQYERIGTYLSLDVGLPKPDTLHEIFVACDLETGKVLGLAEVDARTNGEGGRGQDGPYMCNVAVDPNHQRKGIASSLIQKCEEQVQIWSSNTNRLYLSRSLYLKVRTTNEAATSMYDKLGYSSVCYETQKDNELILVMRKQLPELLHSQQQQEKTETSQTKSYMNGLLVGNNS